MCYNNYKWALKQDEKKLIDHYYHYFEDFKVMLRDCLRGWVVDKKHVIDGTIKLPTGTAFIMNYGGVTGHTGTVARVIYKGNKAIQIETREGNRNNKTGRVIRNLSEGSIKWFIVSPELLINPDFKGVIGKSVVPTTGKENTK